MENIATKIKKVKEDYIAERLEKVSKYKNRLERHEKTIGNQSWQVVMSLKNKDQKLISVDFEPSQPYVRKYLVLDSGYSSKNNIICYDSNSFINLKQQQKRLYKKLLQESVILAPLSKSSVIMKSLAKVVAKYNKGILFVSDKDYNNPLEEIVKNYQNKAYLKINKGKALLTLGYLKDSEETLAKRINVLKDCIINNNLELSDISIKPSFGKPISLTK